MAEAPEVWQYLEPQHFQNISQTPGGVNELLKPRQRAFASCGECHERKVRCDAHKNGTPCSNCRFHDRSCAIRKRKRKSQHSTDEPRARRGSLDSVTSKSNRDTITDAQAQTKSPSWKTAESTMPDKPKPFDLDGWNWLEPQEPVVQGGNIAMESITPPVMQTDADHASDAAKCYEEPPATRPIPLDELIPIGIEGQETEVSYTTYAFIAPLHIDNIPEEDLQILTLRRSFYLPAPSILNKLLIDYFKAMQPQLPILDPESFFSLISGARMDGGYEPISLFVLQAILPIAASLLSSSEIQILGFESVRKARQEYYRRAKALFDMHVEKDNFALAQGALLMTYFTPPSDTTAHTYWLRVAIQAAKDLSAHDSRSHIGLEQKRIDSLKRLWWCCIVRDRTLGLGLRRPLQIPKAALKHDLAYLEINNSTQETPASVIYTGAAKRALDYAFHLLCELSIVMTDTLELLYPTWAASSSVTQDNTSTSSLEALRSAEQQLDTWVGLQYADAQHKGITRKAGETTIECLLIMRKMVFIYYHSAKAALHNGCMTELIARSDLHSSQSAALTRSKTQLEKSIRCITGTLMDMLKPIYLSQLPVAVTALMALPLIWHVLGSKLAKTTTESEIINEQIQAYHKIMKVCQERFEGTDNVIESISQLVDHIRLDDPPESDNSFSKDLTTHRGDWTRLLLKRPQSYCRMIFALDICLAKGRHPRREEYPRGLQWPSTQDWFRFVSIYPLATGSTVDLDDKFRNTFPNRKDEQHESDHLEIGQDLAMIKSSDIPQNSLYNAIDDAAWTMLDEINTGNMENVDIFAQLLQGYAEAGIGF